LKEQTLEFCSEIPLEEHWSYLWRDEFKLYKQLSESLRQNMQVKQVCWLIF